MVDLENATVVDEALIQEVTRRIVERFHPEKVILFGSHARGNARPDSDLDLIVVMESDKPFVKRTTEVRQLFYPRAFSLDLFAFTPEEMKREQEHLGTLVSMLAEDRKLLYAA